MGKSIKQYIEKALKTEKDPEVKSRLEKTLSEIDKTGTSIKEEDKIWIKEGLHDPKTCCAGREHCMIYMPCKRCARSKGYPASCVLCWECAKQLDVCSHCQKKLK